MAEGCQTTSDSLAAGMRVLWETERTRLAASRVGSTHAESPTAGMAVSSAQEARADPGIRQSDSGTGDARTPCRGANEKCPASIAGQSLGRSRKQAAGSAPMICRDGSHATTAGKRAGDHQLHGLAGDRSRPSAPGEDTSCRLTLTIQQTTNLESKGAPAPRLATVRGAGNSSSGAQERVGADMAPRAKRMVAACTQQ